MKMEKAAKTAVVLFFAAITIFGLSGSSLYGLPQASMELQDAAVYAPLTFALEHHPLYENKILWQGYTWLVFMAGLYALYAFSRETGVGRIFSCLGVMAMYFCPRFFAQGHYSRAMVLLSLLLCLLWQGVRFLKKPNVFRAVWFAAAGALVVNVSPAAGIVWAAFFACAIVMLTAQKAWNGKTIAGAAVSAVMFAALVLLVGAASQEGSMQTAAVLFRGHVYDPAVNPLPWYAIFWMAAITTPLFVGPLTLCGQIAVGRRVWEKRAEVLRDPVTYALVIASLCWIVPLVWAMFQPQISHSWQTVCFFNAGMVVLMARGVMGAYHFGRHFGGDCGMHIVFVAGLLLFFGWTARDISRNQPYEYAYFNRLGHNVAVRQMMLDGENVSAFNALKTLLEAERNTEHPLVIGAADPMSRKDLEAAWTMLPAEQQKKLSIESAQDAPYLFANTSYFRLNRCRIPRGYHKLFELKSYDLIICTVYEKN